MLSDRRLQLQLQQHRSTITQECADITGYFCLSPVHCHHYFQMPPENAVSFSAPASKPTLRTNKCLCLKSHRSADLAEVHPDRTPSFFFRRRPLIGRGFVSFPRIDLVTSSAFSSYIIVWLQSCQLTSNSLHYKSVYLNPFLTLPWFIWKLQVY